MKREMKSEPTALDREVAQMPPLRHSMPGEPFDIRRSQVAQWLCRQPAVMQWVYDTAKDRETIVYDREAGTWQGARYGG